MKILVINASPNKENSTTLKLTKSFLEGMGEEATYINTIDLNTKPCRACYSCWFRTNGNCVIKDDATKVLALIKEADLVIWSIPLYCYGAPSHCKALMDRTLSFNDPKMYLDSNKIGHHYGFEEGNKKTILISTGGLPNVNGNFDGLIFTFKHMYGNSTEAICASEASLFMNKETSELVKPYLEMVKKAGLEYKNQGFITDSTREYLNNPVINEEAYVNNANSIFDSFKQM